jgi:AcrR family transcriptional regulator
MTASQPPREQTRAALLDAAERILIESGYPAATTRAIAAEANVNHGLVHYYFGSVDNLLLETLKRFSAELFERQRALYAEDRPFIEKWRTAMGHLTGSDRESGYGKLWLELQAMSWNRPEMRAYMAEINAEWRQILLDAFNRALIDYDVDPERFPAIGVVALIMTFNLGVQIEATGGVSDGHAELLQMADALIVDLERTATSLEVT